MTEESRTSHCIPSELSIQWRGEWEGYIASERKEKIKGGWNLKGRIVDRQAGNEIGGWNGGASKEKHTP